MNDDLVFGLYIFALATFVGYQVIARVPPLLHTPPGGAGRARSAGISLNSARSSRRGPEHSTR